MLQDLTGQKFNKWTVLGRSKNPPNKENRYWDCVCECGNTTILKSSVITSESSNSCRDCSYKALREDFILHLNSILNNLNKGISHGK